MEKLVAGDPQRIGAYRLLARLGAGGMGRVYLARSDRGRTVAVKLVRRELAEQEEFRNRFRQEVAAARRVGGAWTAPVLDADTEAPVPWLATGYVAGPTLHSVVSGGHGPLPERSVRILASGLAHALQDIHAAGLIHRDLKPSNVLVTIEGPRVIDFGIARALETVTAEGLTRTGALVGSPGFMAPEQVRGDRVTAACDVFCLGSVLAYAATGRLPFGGADSGAHALMYRIAQEAPDLSGLPEQLAILVHACLQKEPAARPTTRDILARVGEAADAGAGPGGEPWLPGGLLAQLGRHAVRLLEHEDPTGQIRTPERREPRGSGAVPLGVAGAAGAVPGVVPAPSAGVAPGAGTGVAPGGGTGTSPGAGAVPGPGVAGAVPPGAKAAPAAAATAAAAGQGSAQQAVPTAAKAPSAQVPAGTQAAPTGPPAEPQAQAGPGLEAQPQVPHQPQGQAAPGQRPGAEQQPSAQPGPEPQAPAQGQAAPGQQPQAQTQLRPEPEAQRQPQASASGQPQPQGQGQGQPQAQIPGQQGRVQGQTGPQQKAQAGRPQGQPQPAAPAPGQPQHLSQAQAQPQGQPQPPAPAPAPAPGQPQHLSQAQAQPQGQPQAEQQPQALAAAPGQPQQQHQSRPVPQAQVPGQVQRQPHSEPAAHGQPVPPQQPNGQGHGQPQGQPPLPAPAPAPATHALPTVLNASVAPAVPAAPQPVPQQPHPYRGYQPYSQYSPAGATNPAGPANPFGPTPPYGPAPVPAPEQPSKRSARGTAALIVVALIVAIGAGGSVYAFMNGGSAQDDGQAEGSASPAPKAPADSTPPSSPTASPTDTAGAGAVPEEYLGSWSSGLETAAGFSTRRLVIRQGEIGETVLTLTADGPAQDGGKYHCVFEAPLAAAPEPGAPLRIGPSEVTEGEPMSSCTPGKPTELTIRPDGSLHRESKGGESLTYGKDTESG
ncbi:protein kinase [Streptomyces sp. NPDC059396]|uniref:serine/threonine-protein kinase n=1 Tax=Streptomyces sp. NPDC059396 TaxID=3346819 RepID=UPI00367B7AA0